MDTAYIYGNERIALERFTGWTGYYTYDPRGSVSGVTDSEGKLWKSYRYSPTGDLTFGKPQYNNSYSYNAEDYNPNLEVQYLRARYYDVERGNFLTEDPYLGRLTDPLSLNRYNYVKSSAPNYVDPSGYAPDKDSSYGELLVLDKSLDPDYGVKTHEELMDSLDTMIQKLRKALQNLKNQMDEAERRSLSEELCYFVRMQRLILSEEGIFGLSIHDYIQDQNIFESLNAPFGFKGNVAENGCGWIALYNILHYLGKNVNAIDLLIQINIEWRNATVAGGKLGLNPLYMLKMLEKFGFDASVMQYYKIAINDEGKGIYPEVEDAAAYIILYSWRDGMQIGAHYQFVKKEEGGIKTYNFEEFYDNISELYNEKMEREGLMTLSLINVNR